MSLSGYNWTLGKLLCAIILTVVTLATVAVLGFGAYCGVRMVDVQRESDRAQAAEKASQKAFWDKQAKEIDFSPYATPEMRR